MDKTFDVQCELKYVPDYPPLYNDPELTEFVKNSLESMNDKEIKKVVEFPVFSGSEDFSYYAEKIPGCFFFTLAVNRKGWRRHISITILNSTLMKMPF
ncbi:M20/M25/M40 family metallo-hydrolase [Peribacillus frigoritolerans]|uniref:M20/M25/M40 family metallo-hydrolase n=1 Tax=Peribacillus frigoritolerans TaxID=450367 RepID=UPI00399D4DD6